MSFTGGKLKFKGGDALGVKKKKKKGSKALVVVDAQDAEQTAMKASLEGTVLDPDQRDVDRRTPAERKHEEMLLAREMEKVAKLAGKSHRDRVKDFNDYLANLSEHHDIPKVGPG